MSFARSISLVLAGRASVILGGIVTSVIVARSLGAEGRGHYFTIITSATLLAQLANCGVSSSNTVIAARTPDDIPVLVRNSAALAAGLAAVTMASLAVVGRQVAAALQIPLDALILVPLLASAILLFTLLTSIVTAQERFGALGKWQSLNTVLSLGFTVAAGTLSAGPTGFVMSTTAAAILVTALLYARLPRSSAADWNRRLAVARSGLGYSTHAYLALLFAFALQRSGVYALGSRGTASEVGVFSVALQIHDVLMVLPSAGALVLLPRIARSGESGWVETRRMLALVGTILVAGACVVALVAEPVITGVFGKDFRGTGDVVRALMPGAVALGLTSVLSQYLVSRRFPRSLVCAWLIGLVATVALASRFAESHGAVGTAWAQTAGAGLVLVICVALVARRRREEALLERSEHDLR